MNFYQELEYLTAHPLDEKDLSFIPKLVVSKHDEDIFFDRGMVSTCTFHRLQQRVIKQYKPIISHICEDLASEFEGHIVHTNDINKLKAMETTPFEKLFKSSLSGITRHTMKPTIKLVLDYYREYITINRGLF